LKVSLKNCAWSVRVLHVYLEDFAWLVKVAHIFVDIDANNSMLETKTDALI
jgi:hypothetical protein